VPTYLLRVWLPDRPGALGQVAGRVGAVRGDLVGIDILERNGGRAIDELTVNLPNASLVGLLVSEICEVDGVEVDDVRPMRGELPDPRLDSLETAAHLVEQPTAVALLEALVARTVHDFGADWATVIDTAGPKPLAVAGDGPPAAWLASFVSGSGASAPKWQAASDEVAWAGFDECDLAVVVGRKDRVFRTRERRQLAALARIADRRWSELVRQEALGVRHKAM
jgi:hypothetical protein